MAVIEDVAAEPIQHLPHCQRYAQERAKTHVVKQSAGRTLTLRAAVQIVRRFDRDHRPCDLRALGHARDRFRVSLGLMPRPEQFECSVLLPPAPFATDERPTPDNASGSDGSLIAIAIPCGAVDLLQDLRNVVLDSAEGFWLGSFAFARVPAEDAEGGSLEPDAPLDPDAPCPTDGSRADVPISSWTEVGVVFDGPAYADLSVPRVLRVVDAPADELEVRTHVARVRDVLVGTSAALVGRVGFEMTPYDPSATAVDAGLSVYAAMRASSKATAMPSAPVAGPSSPVQPDRACRAFAKTLTRPSPDARR